MNSYALSFKINNSIKEFEVQAKNFQRGSDEVIFNDALFNNAEMQKNGYIIENLPSAWYKKINKAITDYIINKLKINSVDVPSSFDLGKYHTYVNDDIHQKIVSDIGYKGFFKSPGIPIEVLDIDPVAFDNFVTHAVDGNFSLKAQIRFLGFKERVFWLRIVRPGSGDNNPPHKDVHIKRIKDNVNVYLPLAGSNENSSLPLIPGTHTENERNYIVSSAPCYVNGKKFTVPAVVHRNNGLNMITPNPALGQVMIFTPNLIHGGGVNSNTDQTRVSVEMRFFKH
jgi:hypothetical protein